MGVVIGMDEAGYGPNLGPLVVAATVWEVPGDPRAADFWALFDDVVSQRPCAAKLHVGDSKAVYSPARGIGPLERSALAILSLPRCGGLNEAASNGQAEPLDFARLLRCVGIDADGVRAAEPWFVEPLPLPLGSGAAVAGPIVDSWARLLEATGVRLRVVACDVVLTARWNGMVREHGSKGLAHSRNCLRLLRQLWSPDEECLVIADKHGGRNRYDALLAEVLDGEMVTRHEEGRHLSRYRVGKSELHFRTRAESHFPVACASLVAKYLREAAMELFNRFWLREVPALRPTKGYPSDAARFRQDITAAQTRLGIPTDSLWRER
jgi:hypothetical protein